MPGFPLEALPAKIGLVTDYRALCAPHVENVRDVLSGKTQRYKLRFENAVFIFHHGCLMVRVVEDGHIRALPPFSLERDGTPYLHALPEHQQPLFGEFMQLPKSTLLFYFYLLKEVFKGYALRCRWSDPVTGRKSWVSMPEALRPFLSEVGWNVRTA